MIRTHSQQAADPNQRARPIALVLGATGGIGQAYCRALAARGMDLCISGRNETKLQALATELRSMGDCQIETLVADFRDPADRNRIEASLRDNARMTWLVNAAGTARWERFVESNDEAEQQMFDINLTIPANLVRSAIRVFQTRPGGTIVHIASAAAFYSVPYLATYCATKGAAVQLFRAIAEEIRGQGIRLQVLCPGFVKTEMFQLAGADADRLPRMIWMDADRVVKASLHAVDRNRLVCIPGARYRWFMMATQWVPSRITCRVAGWMFGDFSKYRLRSG